MLTADRPIWSTSGRAVHSGLRIAVPPQDVHEYGTAIVRSAMMTQANPSVRPALLFVLHTRGAARSAGPTWT